MADRECTNAEDITDNLACERGGMVLFELCGVSAGRSSRHTYDEQLTAKVNNYATVSKLFDRESIGNTTYCPSRRSM